MWFSSSLGPKIETAKSGAAISRVDCICIYSQIPNLKPSIFELLIFVEIKTYLNEYGTHLRSFLLLRFTFFKSFYRFKRMNFLQIPSFEILRLYSRTTIQCEPCLVRKILIPSTRKPSKLTSIQCEPRFYANFFRPLQSHYIEVRLYKIFYLLF